MGDILNYGLLAIGIISVVVGLFYFIFGRLMKTYLEKNQGWIIFGFLISIIIGFFAARMFVPKICQGVMFFSICKYILSFIFVVGFAILFYGGCIYKKKEF